MNKSVGAPRAPANWVRGLTGLLVLAALLEIVPRMGLVSSLYLPPISVMVAALIDECQTSEFWLALALTLRSWAIGLAIAVIAGAALGFLIGSSSILRRFTASTIELLRPIPSVALIPLVVLLFGTTIKSTLVLVVYASIWQVLIQVLYGVQDVDPVMRQTAYSYRFGYLAKLRYVTWPTALPYLMTGIRLSAAVALILTITSELIIGAPGLGKEIALAQSGGAVATMYAYLIVTGLIGVAVNVAARRLERITMSWHPSLRPVEAS
ncbi:MAG: ABC transporter permease [Rhizobiaceae bacterium]|nr:MAG: ABC transporter permease [Rhizobiaceae bacterium]